MKLTGKLHSFESCGTVDGPGIRFIVFTQGCPLRCKYCHNPDTWDIKDAKYERDIEFTINEIKKYKPFFRNGGGLTITGGEPFVQMNYIEALFKRSKEEGIHTAIDTSGYIFNDRVKEVLEYVDLVLLDIKSINPITYKELTGVELENTLKFAEYLDSIGKPVWIRHVVVPGITDRKENLEKLADYISKLKNVEKIELLPFHQLGTHKWEEMNLDYPLKDAVEPTAKEMKDARQIFRDKGLNVG
ncbi:pyruvate formate-lyase-activating protein [Psychrilyobacter sp.]|uniref:pyruvate formate-lyase-activating protein n=1 Tax=Psychrilyobacter sp. TaxID=2586924 RepID=UPI00301B208A